ncbi:MAG: hypothetical protein GEU94_04685 [Micromonosporaceae bacterium]|nr:hypothetical protein [Micromonosporaceae bacterium]
MVPPTAVAGVVSVRDPADSPDAPPSRPVMVRWLSAHAQVAAIAGLVALASLATAAVVATGARQLTGTPSRATTPYIAARPSGPVRAPDVTGVETGGTPAAPRDESARDKASGSSTSDRGRSPSREPQGKAPRTQEKTPRTPEARRPPKATPPGEESGRRLPKQCRARTPQALARCAFRTPKPPMPARMSAIPKPPRLR